MEPQPAIDLLAPCKLHEGIIAIPEQESQHLRELFLSGNESKAFFIPASGSGSRMFEFLFDFIQQPTEENRGQVERFLNHITDFAFFHQFPVNVQRQLSDRTMDIDAFVAYILNDNGMGLAHLPKGLIPFHMQGPFLLNPFHEHILQGMSVANNECAFHFTIRSEFQSLIEKRLEHMEGMTGKRLNISFSEQNTETDAYAFTPSGEVVVNDAGAELRRPAGHGALLENLNAIEADIIFIKNIDNVQHLHHSGDAIATQQLLGGLLIRLQSQIGDLLNGKATKEQLIELNDSWELYHPTELEKPLDELITLLRRPLRICGMVRNEGQPGGGPFWVQEATGVSKQIVEKAQIAFGGEHFKQMLQSTHFNPVMMACSTKLRDGSRVDFMQYRDVEKYFIVNKKYQGKDVRFTELPGLWNGSMAHWNTVFVEIPSTTFSPVKTILDLLEAAHQG